MCIGSKVSPILHHCCRSDACASGFSSLADAFFPEVGIATLELLERFGYEVVYPHDQTCCGQPMANSGFNAEAADTEALFVRNFSGFDYVVAPSGSCKR
jgi:Fe-S oxidoreductase